MNSNQRVLKYKLLSKWCLLKWKMHFSGHFDTLLFVAFLAFAFSPQIYTLLFGNWHHAWCFPSVFLQKLQLFCAFVPLFLSLYLFYVKCINMLKSFILYSCQSYQNFFKLFKIYMVSEVYKRLCKLNMSLLLVEIIWLCHVWVEDTKCFV